MKGALVFAKLPEYLIWVGFDGRGADTIPVTRPPLHRGNKRTSRHIHSNDIVLTAAFNMKEIERLSKEYFWPNLFLKVTLHEILSRTLSNN